jgi:ADP-ribose pyrophosphatase YjhB (NUDIX family)
LRQYLKQELKVALSLQEQAKLVDLLEKLEPGYYPFEVFMQFARLNTIPCVECLVIRTDDYGKLEVLLTNRKVDDPLWPSKPHIPGCVVRPGESLEVVFKRLIDDEIGSKSLTAPVEVLTELRQSKRGPEMVNFYYVELQDEPKNGKFYKLSQLPEDLIEDHAELIKKAANEFNLNSQL